MTPCRAQKDHEREPKHGHAVMAKLHGDEGALVVCLNNLADWKINTGCYQEALEMRQECLQLSRKINARIGVGRADELDGHHAVQQQVMGQEDQTHPAAPDGAEQAKLFEAPWWVPGDSGGT